MPNSFRNLAVCVVCSSLLSGSALRAADYVRDLQTSAITEGKSPLGHWGTDPANYTAWGSHSNRLIPVYAFGAKGAGKGADLDDYSGKNSPFRNEASIRRIFGTVPTNTLNPQAEYFDQTDLAAVQRAAFANGKKHVFLVIFDGMDWQTTWAAAIYNRREIPYREGRGTGLHFLDYDAGGTTQYGWMVTSPHNEGTKTDVDTQRVLNPGGKVQGGYNVAKGGPNPWTPGNDLFYPIGKTAADPKGVGEHAYPDSSATAMAMTSGVKSYNNAINIDATGNQVATVAHDMQPQGYKIGVVTSVPISHATPACAYAHNVHRDDYQDLTRDLIGRPSISHPKEPLSGVDVLIGGGFAVEAKEHARQGKNFVPGNVWITNEDLSAIDVSNGGKYVISQRTSGQNGRQGLLAAADRAAREGGRLFGFYGGQSTKGHLPFQTADGKYNPTVGRNKSAEKYSPADLEENPRLADMTAAALTVLEKNPRGFWLMVEAGDVDWANHDDNIDNSIGAVNSGDLAVKTITDWVEKHSSWRESLLIVTADHGHYLILDHPELLTGK
jgi:alkaline phosphatase